MKTAGSSSVTSRSSPLLHVADIVLAVCTQLLQRIVESTDEACSRHYPRYCTLEAVVSRAPGLINDVEQALAALVSAL